MSKHNYTPKKLIKILRKHGFQFIRQNGSHAVFKNFNDKTKVVVPIHNRDIPKGTAIAILKDAGIIT
jgi:mRNA interferase HicA